MQLASSTPRYVCKLTEAWAGCRMISAFGSGAAFSLVSGMAAGNKLQGAFTTGTLFALFQGVFFVVSRARIIGP